jgi:glycine dehydrogenase subunit 2
MFIPHTDSDREAMLRAIGAKNLVEGRWPDAPDVHDLDIAKRMMDFHLHPQTNYFPLIVHEALMIEPTETESKQTQDLFVEIMLKIAEEAHNNAEILKTAPHITPLGRLDEVKAAKELVLCCGVGTLEPAGAIKVE